MQIWNLNRVCHFLYELVLLFALIILCLAPFHATAIRHTNIDRIVDSATVGFRMKDVSFLKPGDVFPVYRFNPDWTTEIGWVKLQSINKDEVVASYDSNSFLWPMGRQGRILDINYPLIKVSLGSQVGLKEGDLLCLFNERKLVGKITLQDVSNKESWGKILYLTEGDLSKNLTVSEFTYVTQVAVLKNPILFFAEIGTVLFFLLFYLYLFIFKGESFFSLCGNWLKLKYSRFRYKEEAYYIINLFLGFFFVWFLMNFIPRCFVYLYNTLINYLTPIFKLPFLPNINPWLHKNIWLLYILGLTVYFFVLILKRQSPIILFWKSVAYKPKEKKLIKGPLNDFIVWALHLIIFYAFGNTLILYLKGNSNQVVSILWPGLSLIGVISNIFHLPAVKHLNWLEVFSVLRYFLWSITIVGCLFGYIYSVVGYLYGKKIRNLDFTIMGWITNALCYGYLLGAPLFQMVPSTFGMDPAVSHGPLLVFMVVGEFVLNLLYTLTIWNLGKMFGVMTDKGVRVSGFYSVVRHPSYTLEALMFAMIFLNSLSSPHEWFAVFILYILTYYMRSEREDQFMAASNPDYKTYQKRTQYKFIPGIY